VIEHARSVLQLLEMMVKEIWKKVYMAGVCEVPAFAV